MFFSETMLEQIKKTLINRISQKRQGQSFVELALILPLLLIMLAGMVEVAFLMFAYLTALDLSREAARFASARDYQVQIPASGGSGYDYCIDDSLHYYYDSACFFTDDEFNPFLEFNPAKYDDVTITVLTIANSTITERRDWSLYSDNWQKDCDGNIVRSSPFFSNADIQNKFSSLAPGDRGLVIVEAWVCYNLILNFPIISDITPSPFRLHAYTIMPAPEALPTPTPIP